MYWVLGLSLIFFFCIFFFFFSFLFFTNSSSMSVSGIFFGNSLLLSLKRNGSPGISMTRYIHIYLNWPVLKTELVNLPGMGEHYSYESNHNSNRFRINAVTVTQI